MSASVLDMPCLYCGKVTNLQDHWVYEKAVFRNVETGALYAQNIVHPCVFKFEEEQQYEAIPRKPAYGLNRAHPYSNEDKKHIGKENKPKKNKKT